MIRVICGWIALVGGIVGGLYVGGWIMFIKPIIELCEALDAGTLTGLIVGATILKCVFAGAVGSIILSVGAGITKHLLDD